MHPVAPLALTSKISPLETTSHVRPLWEPPHSVSYVLGVKTMPSAPATNVCFLEHALPPLPNEEALTADCKPAMVVTSASLSNSFDVTENTQPFISVQPVDNLPMEPFRALDARKSNPLHPFNLSFLQTLLCETSLSFKYPTIIHSFSVGFIVGIPPLRSTFTPPNSATITTLYSEFCKITNKEFLLGRYIGPFTCESLEQYLGPFQSSPLSLVPKPHSSNFRLIQNLSYLHRSFLVSSINSHISSADYPCTFGTFLTVCLVINSLPPHSQAATRDVADAYRTIPVHHSQ